MPLDFSDRAEPVEQGNTLLGVGRQVPAGINQKLFDVIDAVPGLGEAIFNALTGGSFNDPVTRVTEASGLRDIFVGPEPQTTAERVARRTGQEIGASLPLAVAPFAAAARPALTATQQSLAPLATRVGETFLQGIRNTPLRAAAGELAAATGAGIGAGIAQEEAPGSVLAETAGQLAGGLAPTVAMNTPTALVARTAARFPGRVRHASEQEVSRSLGGALTPDAERNLGRALELRDEIPGFDPTLAEATGSPTLIRTQEQIESEATGSFLDSLAVRRRRSEESLQRFEVERAPQGFDSPDLVVDEAGNRVTRLSGQIKTARATLDEQQRQLGDAIPPASLSERGANLRGIVQRERRLARDRLTAARKDLGLDEPGVTMPFSEFKGRASAIAADRPFSGPASSRVFKRIQDMGDDITLQEWDDLRTATSDAIRDTEFSQAQGKNRELRALYELQAEVDGLIDVFATARGENARIFRDRFFNEVVQPFEQGVARRVRAKGRDGTYLIRDENVAAAFFERGNVTAARQFNLTFGNAPQARAAMNAVILDKIRDAAVVNGAVDPGKLAEWTRKHASVLAEFPEMRDVVNSVSATAESLARRQAALTARETAMGKSILARTIRRVEGAESSPETVLRRAMENPALMRRIMNGLRQSDVGMAALRKTVWGEMVALDDLGPYLEKHAKSLRMVLGADHYRDLQTLAEARTIQGRTAFPHGRGFRPDPVGAVSEALGAGVPQLASRFYAFKSGRLPRDFLLADAGSRILRGRSIINSRALMAEALYNPQVARDMARIHRAGKVTPEIANRLNVRFFNLGMESRRSEEEQTRRIDFSAQ